MDYPATSSPSSKQPRKKSSPISASTSSTQSPPLTSTESVPTIRYVTASSAPSPEYESPYTRGEDLPRGRQRSSASRAASRSSGIHPDFIDPNFLQQSGAMSSYSSSSRASSTYSSPGPHQYKLASGMASSSRASISQADREQMLKSLRTHRVNTLTELRRIEKLLAPNGSTTADVTEAMTTAWAHYVNSNNLLSELRGLTKNYPFSSECLDEAKWQVIGDPNSTKSWNYAWLILTKIKQQGLIPKHARQQAAKPVMWGGRNPSAANIEKLAQACMTEWTRALDQMLKQWSSPPSASGGR